jgi:hypothetical protein
MKRFRYWFVAVAVIAVAPLAFGEWDNAGVWKKIVNATTGKIEIKTDIDGDGTNEVTIDEDGSLSVGTMHQTVTAHGSVATGTVTFTPGIHTITVAGDQAWAFSGWPASGKEGKITIYVTNGGSATITGLAGPIFSSGGEPSLTAAGKDVLVLTTFDGGTTVYGFLTGLDVK